MAYTPPVDPTPGSPIRAIDTITYVYENIRYFFNGRALDSLLYSKAAGADISYNSASWGIIDAGVTKTLTINSTRAKVRCSFRPRMAASGAGTQWGYFDIAMDGVRAGNATFGLATIGSLQQNHDSMTLEALFTNVSAGSHVFTVQAKYLAGTATGGSIYIDGSASNHHQPFFMIVEEG